MFINASGQLNKACYSYVFLIAIFALLLRMYLRPVIIGRTFSQHAMYALRWIINYIFINYPNKFLNTLSGSTSSSEGAVSANSGGHSIVVCIWASKSEQKPLWGSVLAEWGVVDEVPRPCVTDVESWGGWGRQALLKEPLMDSCLSSSFTWGVSEDCACMRKFFSL